MVKVETLEPSQSSLVNVDDKEYSQKERVMVALNEYYDLLKQYKILEYKKKDKEATLRIYTDWKTALPEISRLTNDDKAAYIRTVMKDCYHDLMELRLQKNYLKEIYEIERIMLEKNCIGKLDGD